MGSLLLLLSIGSYTSVIMRLFAVAIKLCCLPVSTCWFNFPTQNQILGLRRNSIRTVLLMTTRTQEVLEEHDSKNRRGRTYRKQNPIHKCSNVSLGFSIHFIDLMVCWEKHIFHFRCMYFIQTLWTCHTQNIHKIIFKGETFFQSETLMQLCYPVSSEVGPWSILLSVGISHSESDSK